MTNRRSFLVIAARSLLVPSLLALGGCATDQTVAAPTPGIGFDHLPPMALKVADVDVKSEFTSSMKVPNIEHRMPAPPAQALQDWAQTRLQWTGAGTAKAEFVIEDASVVAAPLAKSEGLKGIFTFEPTDEYTANVVARLTISDPATGGGGQVRAAANRIITVSENATLEQREQRWVELVESLMADFNSEMENQMQMHLGAWLK